MSPIQAVSSVFRQYMTFNGRASRSEFWWFYLFHFIGLIILVNIHPVLFLLFFGTILPYFAVSARRLHDTNRSGWWILLGLVPFVGLVLLILYVQPSDEGTNQYGPNPKVYLGDTTTEVSVGVRQSCSNCGVALEDSMIFCPSCGRQI